MDRCSHQLHVGFKCLVDKSSSKEYIFKDVESFEFFNGDLVIRYFDGGYTFIPLLLIVDESIYWVK